jgi:hypothetical protein
MTSGVVTSLSSATVVSKQPRTYFGAGYLIHLLGSASQVVPAIIDDVASITQFIRVSLKEEEVPMFVDRNRF